MWQQDSTPSLRVPPSLIDTHMDSLPGLPVLVVAIKHLAFFLKALALLCCSPSSGKPPCYQGQGPYKYDDAFARLSSLGTPQAVFFRGPEWHYVPREAGRMASSLILCHISSLGPRWLCLISESPAVTPAQVHQLLIFIPHLEPLAPQAVPAGWDAELGQLVLQLKPTSSWN